MNETLIAGAVLAAVVLAGVFMRLNGLERRLGAFSRLDAKLDALLNHAGIPFDPYRDVPPAVVDAVRRGEKIEAIKRYREATGAGLKEAKEYVEELQRRARVGV